MDEFEEASELLTDRATLNKIKEMEVFQWISFPLNLVVFLTYRSVAKRLIMVALTTILH